MKNEIEEIVKIDKEDGIAEIKRGGEIVKVKFVELDENGNPIHENLFDVVKKKWYKSKTMIFNLGTAAFTGIGSLLGDDSFRQMVGEYFSYILTVVTVVNVYLRTVTDKAVGR